MDDEHGSVLSFGQLSGAGSWVAILLELALSMLVLRAALRMVFCQDEAARVRCARWVTVATAVIVVWYGTAALHGQSHHLFLLILAAIDGWLTIAAAPPRKLPLATVRNPRTRRELVCR